MRVFFIAGREPGYVRNVMLLKALKLNGVEVIECTDSSKTYLTRLPRVLGKFWVKRTRDVDAVLVGFFGQPLVQMIRLLIGKPVVFDAFLSVYDTLCFERRQFTPSSVGGRVAFWLDRSSCEAADLVLLDTAAHIDYFAETFALPREKFRRVLVGADESVFFPRERRRGSGPFRVFYYASLLPLHGTEFIVRAAALLLEQRDVELVIVGTGREREKVRALASELATSNVKFVDWIPFAELPAEIADADICLGGHFSDFEKAKRVIAGKTYQFIAMKKAVILGDCVGNRELFVHEQNALLVQMADPRALADAILRLRDDPALVERLAEAGYQTFLEKCTTQAISRELASALRAIV